MMKFTKLLGFSILSIFTLVAMGQTSSANGMNSLSINEAENDRVAAFQDFELGNFIIKTDFAIEVGGELKGGALAKRKAKKRVKRRAVIKRKIKRTVRKTRINKRPRAVVRRAPERPVRQTTQASAPRSSFNQDVLEQQEALNLLGFDAGRPDGVTGRRTRAAISQFQTANGLVATGRFSPQGLALLTQQAAVASAGGTIGGEATQQVAAPTVPATPQVLQPTIQAVVPQTATAQPTQGLPAATQQAATQPAVATQPATQQVVEGQPAVTEPKYDGISPPQVVGPQPAVAAPAAQAASQEVLLPPVQTEVKPQQSTPQW